MQPFYEEMSYLVGSAGADELKSLTALLGYKWNKNVNIGLMGIFKKFENSQNNNSSVYGLINYSQGDWRYAAGLGQYQSSHQTSNLSALLQVSWIGLPSLALFE